MYPELLAIVLVTVVSLGCQQTPSDDFRGNVKFSTLVATGEVTDSISDTSYQMTLKCILKDSGTRPPAIINITHTSNNLDGRCFINKFQKGKSYLVFLRYIKPNYTPLSNEEEPSKIADVLKECGLGVVSKVPTDSRLMSTTCPNVEARACPTTVPPTTPPRKKKTPPALPMATKNRMDNTEKQTIRTTFALRTTTMRPQPQATEVLALPMTTKNRMGNTEKQTIRTTFALGTTTMRSQPQATEVKDNKSQVYNNTASQGTGNTTWYIMWYITWRIICLFYRKDV
ncbi:uncharacterized protein LOC110446925 [Mizuhopecten yessoensis]|uniref:Uncharacterized protein n=1 Tax=Mizuhopecten yessoensis TaxID=6573 RepID=A0A210QWF4_MIZYE|nr:uncharacterized protein LOC110446925 [Mizuhopecten yessoensis]OWF53041.1 hypothetical protein KP79_PYT08143 [Mizuhopecten yessoensis]